MKLEKLDIDGAWISTSRIFSDDRGSFREWFKGDQIREATLLTFNVAQANLSVSNKGVLRGIHYSLADNGQAKWITCASGRILDFVVDIRPDSPTYKKYVCVDLTANDGQAVLIGAGLGHAFLSIEERSVVTYLLDSNYSPSEEFEINPMDLELGIDWQFEKVGGAAVIMSPKDAQAPTLGERLEQGNLPYLKK